MIKLNKQAHARAWAVAAVLAACSGVASAQWYGGAAGGRAHVTEDCADTDSCESSSRGYKAYLGYKSDEVFAVEAGYLNFGRYKSTQGSDFADVKIAGYLAALAMRGHVTPEFTVVGRVGVTFLDTRLNGKSNGQFVGAADHSNKPYIGIGLEYEVMPKVKLTAAADFTKAGAFDGDVTTVRLITLGVQGDF